MPCPCTLCRPEGAFFGEMSFFGLAQERSATIITTTYSELAWMSYKDFSEVLDGDIDLRRRMNDFAHLRREMYEMEQADLNVRLHYSVVCLRNLILTITCPGRTQIKGDITCIDEAEKTAEVAAMQKKIAEVYQRIQTASAKAMAADGKANMYVMSEAEQTQLRLFQVETSVLRIHELCHHMAGKVGVDASAVEKFKPVWVPGHNQDCL